MTLAELRKLLSDTLVKLNEFRALKPEDRTDENRAEMKKNLQLYKDTEADIRDFEEIEAAEKRNNVTVNGSSDNLPDATGSINVVDQPIYRGRFQLGQQLRDIFMRDNPGADYEQKKEARSRLEQVEKRAAEFHGIDNVEDRAIESRAAGTGGMVERVSADGGILLQGESAVELMTKGFNNSEVLSRTDSRTTSSQFIDIIGLDEDSRANGSRGGGVRVYTDTELGLMTQSKTKFSKYRVEPKKLTGFYYASDELINDVPMLEGEMSALFSEEFAFKGQDLAIRGSGVGEALGILNAGCVVSQAKETGQTAATIVTQNIVKMKSRAWLRGLSNMVWLVNQDVEPQLLTLTLPVGTGGASFPLYTPAGAGNNGVMGSMMGFPVIPIEQCETLGTVGDIMLVDLSKYMTANKGAINSAMSIHLKFDYNQTAFRFVYRFDGQPKLQNAITPFKGTNTVSPFVTLATR